MTVPSLPPAFDLVIVGAQVDAFERAMAQTPDSADGTLVWSERQDRLDCAVVFAPEVPLEDSLAVALVAMVGLGDALGALVPPVVAVHFRWPDQLHVNGALAGGLRVAWGGEAAAPWIMLGVTVAVAPKPGAESGKTPERTTLHDEGCGDIAPRDLLESFSRHLLHWLSRWNDDGFAPVRHAWLSRAVGLGEPIRIGGARGTALELDSAGALIVETKDGARLTVPLAQALKAPTWLL